MAAYELLQSNDLSRQEVNEITRLVRYPLLIVPVKQRGRENHLQHILSCSMLMINASSSLDTRLTQSRAPQSGHLVLQIYTVAFLIQCLK